MEVSRGAQVFNGTRMCGGPVPSSLSTPPELSDRGEVCALLGVITGACLDGGNYAHALLEKLGFGGLTEGLSLSERNTRMRVRRDVLKTRPVHTTCSPSKLGVH